MCFFPLHPDGHPDKGQLCNFDSPWLDSLFDDWSCQSNEEQSTSEHCFCARGRPRVERGALAQSSPSVRPQFIKMMFKMTILMWISMDPGMTGQHAVMQWSLSTSQEVLPLLRIASDTTSQCTTCTLYPTQFQPSVEDYICPQVVPQAVYLLRITRVKVIVNCM